MTNSIEVEVDISCSCGHTFTSKEVDTHKNQITVESCPDCSKKLENEIDEKEEKIASLEKENEELLREKEELEACVLRLSVSKSLGKDI